MHFCRLTLLLIAYAAIAAAPMVGGQAVRKPAAAQQKEGPLVMPDQQSQFCAAFQDDDKRHKNFDQKLKDAGRNPVAQALVKQTTPDFDGLFQAQLLAVMGNGVFHNWVGSLELSVQSNTVYVKIGFPCVWAAPILLGRVRQDNLYLETGNFSGPGIGRLISVPVDSPAGQALATLVPGERVAATGRLFCSFLPRSSGQSVGCYSNADHNEPGSYWAEITSLRLKTDAVIRFGDDPPPGDVDRINTLRKGNITFYRSDNLETLQEKSRAIVEKEPGPASRNLMEYFHQGTCTGCDQAKTLAVISLVAYQLDQSGKAQRILHPCVVAGLSRPNCVDSIQLYVEGDMPAWTETWGADGPFVPGKAGACYLMGRRDAETLKQRTEEINDLLRPLSKTLESDPAAGRAVVNVCEPLNAAAKKITKESRDVAEAINAVDATVTSDEFEARLKEAVKERAENLGFNASQYDGAIKTVSELVRLCSSITEADFVGPMDPSGQPYLARSGKYQQCVPTSGAIRMVPAGKEQPGLMTLQGLSGYASWDRPKELTGSYFIRFQIQVLLKPTDANAIIEAKDVRQQYMRYLALSASIRIPRRALQDPKFLCPGAHVRPIPGSSADDSERILNAPTRIRWLEVKGTGSVEVELAGLPPGRYQYPMEEQIRSSCPAR